MGAAIGMTARRAATGVALALGLAGCEAAPKPFDHQDAATGYRLRGSGDVLVLSGPPSYEAANPIAMAHCRKHVAGFNALDIDRIDVPGKEYHFRCVATNW